MNPITETLEFVIRIEIGTEQLRKLSSIFRGSLVSGDSQILLSLTRLFLVCLLVTFGKEFCFLNAFVSVNALHVVSFAYRSALFNSLVI